MRTIGIGLDLVGVARVERLLERHGERALERLLTPLERSYCSTRAAPAVHIAARIAAKEAAFKALACDADSRGVGWCDTEVVRGDDGKPTLAFHGHAEIVASRLGVRQRLVSLTHDAGCAAAVVILLG